MQADSKELIEHAALLHDVADWKYSGSENANRDSVKVCPVTLYHHHLLLTINFSMCWSESCLKHFTGPSFTAFPV
jgi:HD superfamily phosphodiesterase